ncbi:uncharacterized protein PG986_013067 [Apiospora aurea]|uniref:Uncharacterized protein n=1 Tax=Apiospora aurea TaxID=335848 RepID=A0ABR1Q1T8_9PEZI
MDPQMKDEREALIQEAWAEFQEMKRNAPSADVLERVQALAEQQNELIANLAAHTEALKQRTADFRASIARSRRLPVDEKLVFDKLQPLVGDLQRDLGAVAPAFRVVYVVVRDRQRIVKVVPIIQHVFNAAIELGSLLLQLLLSITQLGFDAVQLVG